MEAPDTAEPDRRERKIAARYNQMIGERKFSAFWIDAPTRASTGARVIYQPTSVHDSDVGRAGTDIERWSDRFKPKTASAAQAAIRLQEVHQARQYDRDLHPPAVFDAVMEKKRKNKGSEGEILASASSATGEQQCLRTERIIDRFKKASSQNWPPRRRRRAFPRIALSRTAPDSAA